MKTGSHKPYIFITLLLPALFFAVSACVEQPAQERPVSNVNHPSWSVNANIYEVNVRQYTPEGTFRAFAEHLDRLQDMGVDILWFMPITPIGEKNRKGSLGSYYSVKDYTAINPEFGTMEEFKELVAGIHSRGMYVILDWVANHTAWDHHWTETNPEYYTLDESGEFVPPVEDWSDVIDLNYDHLPLWDAMIAELRFWVEEVNVDGFRCDVADMVPTAFWEQARKELEGIKPLFMLAEAESPALHYNAFEAAYGWTFHHIMNQIASGGKDVSAIDNYFFSEREDPFPAGSYKMNFITNHDENSWAGTEFTRLGEGVEAFAVLTASMPGTILIYSGQEAAFDRMLAFFEKDSIDWGDVAYHDFYKTLLGLKNRNRALWNGLAGAELKRVNTNLDEHVFAFIRQHASDKVFVVLNLSDQPLDVHFTGGLYQGSYTEVFSGEHIALEGESSLQMEPWGYRVYEKKSR
jgi:cyclomaltodextrinase / maltogenic alpha-amylase / neopullulanase